jgi:hypothetical protein
MTGDEPIEVDIIVPIHNSSKTLAATLDSALGQRSIQGYPDIVIYICCYDDASTDASLNILEDYDKRYSDKLKSQGEEGSIETHILFSKSADGVSRGAGYARNCAISLRACSTAEYCFLCMLDSDDEMHSNRVAEQVSFLMKLPSDERDRALLGTQFVRDPIDVHYSNWANNLSDERLYLERFREVTLIQPTWMISRQRFCSMGFYMEAPRVDNDTPFEKFVVQEQLRFPSLLRIIHPTAETPATLRLAEDLRFFYTHLQANGTLHLLRCGNMVVYKQASTTSQSSQTSRKLLLQIRVFAFEQCILKDSPHWQYHGKRFVVWNAGRDGKNFVKGLSKEMRNRVYCLVDVDEKKIEQG